MVHDRRMIQITITYRCRVCGSPNIVRNGTNRCGSAQYYCQDCGAHRVLEPATGYSSREKRQVLDTSKERESAGAGAHLWRGAADRAALA